MLEFYRENVKYYLKLAWYRYVGYLALAIFLFAIIAVGLFALREKIDLHLFNILAVSLILSPIVIALVISAFLLSKFLFITLYSLAEYLKDSPERWRILWRMILGKLLSLKFLMTLLVFSLLVFTIGYLTYTQVILESVTAVEIIITLLIYGLVVLLVLTRKTLLDIIKRLWNALPGLLWKGLIFLLILFSQLILIAGIYLVVSFVIVPLIPLR